MPAMAWVVLALIILCMAIPYGKLYLWDRPRRRSKSDRTTIEIEGEQGMSQEHERYEGISEGRTVEVVMESSYVLEALRAPVFVDDLEDFRAVGRALVEAWQERVPGFGVDMQISHGSGEAERLCSVGIVVQWLARTADDYAMSVSREGIAAIKDGEDPWDAYMLAITRASWLWGLEAREMTKSDHQLKTLLVG